MAQTQETFEIKQETITVKQAIAEVYDEIEKSKKEKRKVNVSIKDRETAKMLYLKYRKDAIKYKFWLAFALLIMSFLNVTFFSNNAIEHTIILVVFTFLFGFILQDELGEVGYVEDHIDQTNKKLSELQTVTYYLFDYVPVIRQVAIAITPVLLIAINYAIQTLAPAFTSFANAITVIALIVITFAFNIIMYKKVTE